MPAGLRELFCFDIDHLPGQQRSAALGPTRVDASVRRNPQKLRVSIHANTIISFAGRRSRSAGGAAGTAPATPTSPAGGRSLLSIWPQRVQVRIVRIRCFRGLCRIRTCLDLDTQLRLDLLGAGRTGAIIRSPQGWSEAPQISMGFPKYSREFRTTQRSASPPMGWLAPLIQERARDFDR